MATYGSYRQHAVYRLTPQQCSGAARDRLGAGQLRPAATLVEVRRGGVGWFTGRQTTRPGAGQQQETGEAAPTPADDDDWSFLDGSVSHASSFLR